MLVLCSIRVSRLRNCEDKYDVDLVHFSRLLSVINGADRLCKDDFCALTKKACRCLAAELYWIITWQSSCSEINGIEPKNKIKWKQSEIGLSYMTKKYKSFCLCVILLVSSLHWHCSYSWRIINGTRVWQNHASYKKKVLFKFSCIIDRIMHHWQILQGYNGLDERKLGCTITAVAH